MKLFAVIALCFVSLVANAEPPKPIVAAQSEVIPDAPQRIVSLDDLTTEILLGLGIRPVGVANPDSYRWQGKPLADRLDGVVSLGTPQQPNLERLIRLQPDLILGVSSLHASLFDRLDRLAPTVMYRVSLEPSPRDAVAVGKATLEHLAALTGRQAEARAIVAELDQSLDRGRRVAREKGMAGEPIAVLYPLAEQGLFIVSNEQTLVVSLANRLGGTNPWPLREGHTIHQRIEIHALAREPDAHIFMIGNFSGAPMFESPLWRALPVARNEHYGFLETNYWSFGGPLTANVIMKQMIEVMNGMGSVTQAP
ncbi:iron-siderophore ABC transporter substrate-binding protein [Marinobacter sp. 71-i]|uniref:Iron-siderophore ABC transporter substrate-binding protein n=1 Tax=Marinobacter iranensis TaxID=2962607 RepID=A0ABT5YFR2_9GAMM|nr:iron-siderophore ABC transporter substrate-binding protein [Marinobacter iranensis]MDF0751855.1 iron-siderophore ABC transporter substrate-binding protein [Marinobacter iranensis]